MILFGKQVKVGDKVYSESMGLGSVSSVGNNSVMILHNGQQWRYNHLLIRQGCKKSDIGWRPRHTGNQIKNDVNGDKADKLLSALAKGLNDNYG